MVRDVSRHDECDDAPRAWDVDPAVRHRMERIASLAIEDLMPPDDAPGRAAEIVIPSSDSEADEHDDESTDTEEDDAARSSSHSGEGSATEPEDTPRTEAFGSATEPEDTPRTEAFDGSDAVEDAEESRKTRARITLIRLRDEAFAADPGFKRRSVCDLNAEAVAYLRAGDDLRCVAAFAKVFRKIRENHLAHRHLHVCHTNRSAAYLNLGLHEEALWDARRARALVEERFARDRDARAAAPALCKCQARAGFALVGLGNPRLAKIAFEGGLAMDPAHVECKRGLEEATAAVVADLVAGRGRETFALPPAVGVAGAIANLPHAAPLHRLHPRDALPTRLLTPFQAENDYHVRDTYNYLTVQADIRMPRRHFKYLEDVSRLDAFAAAIAVAVERLRTDARDARVLHLGCGAGVMSMEALRAGAHHVVAADRWLYHAMAAKENLLNNGFGDDQARVVYKRPTDLAAIRDVPVSCNLCVNEMLDDGLLTAGLLPSFRHASRELLLPDAILIPSSATVYAMPVEMRVDRVRGLDVSPMNAHRWSPSHTSATPIGPDAWVPLAPPVEVWHFDFQNPPEESDVKTVDMAFERDGKFNAVVFWYDLRLVDDVWLSTAPAGFRRGGKTSRENDPTPNGREDGPTRETRPTSLHPAVQYLPGEMGVRRDDVIPLTCAHNTVRAQFSVEDAEYLHLGKPDASFPQYHFAMLRDDARARAYDDAIARQVRRVIESEGSARVLDVGAGSGLLSMMAARAGASVAVACEWHGALAAVARRCVAANGLSSRVTVARADAAKLERGKLGVPPEGCNVVVFDLFDAGLTGEHATWMLDQARRNVLSPDAVVVPAAATMYCMGVEAYTSEVCGFDLSAFNKYRWDKTYETTRMADTPHRALTRPKKCFEFFFDGSRGRAAGRESVLRLETIASGYMNAVVFWFDLHMDEHETITTAPPGVGKGGIMDEEEVFGEDRKGLRAARAARDEDAKDAMARAVARHRDTLASNPRTELGEENVRAQLERRKACGDGEESRDGGDASSREIVRAFSPPPPSNRDRAESAAAPKKPEHYWGQALQYLERGVQVRARKRVTLLAKREADRVSFALKEGAGAYVGKPPWKIEWGGGASVESPHFQRVHYCELLVGDYLMRLRSRRFPPIEKEMRMMMAHCGNLFLDPATIAETTHRFACLELVHDQQAFSAGATMEALTKPPLLLY